MRFWRKVYFKISIFVDNTWVKNKKKKIENEFYKKIIFKKKEQVLYLFYW